MSSLPHLLLLSASIIITSSIPWKSKRKKKAYRSIDSEGHLQGPFPGLPIFSLRLSLWGQILTRSPSPTGKWPWYRDSFQRPVLSAGTHWINQAYSYSIFIFPPILPPHQSSNMLLLLVPCLGKWLLHPPSLTQVRNQEVALDSGPPAQFLSIAKAWSMLFPTQHLELFTSFCPHCCLVQATSSGRLEPHGGLFKILPALPFMSCFMLPPE